MSKTIHILGAGFGGLRVALDLGARRRELGDAKIVLVDRNYFHTYTPLLYEVATGFFKSPGPQDESRLAAGLEVDLRGICRARGVDFVQKNISKIDLGSDTLVLALGSETDDYGIPGVLEHGMAYKSVVDALALRRKLLDFIDRKRRGEEVQISIVIGGGGATGSELAAELAQFFRHVVARGDIKSGDYQITLVEIGPLLMAGGEQKISLWAYDRLSHLEVKVLRDTCVKRAEKGKVTMAPRPLKPGENPGALLCDFRAEHERTIEADVFIWCGGVRGPRVLASSGLPLDHKGRVVVDAHGRVQEHPNVWAIGDCAAWEAPALAQAAIDQARMVAANIVRARKNADLRVYTIKDYPLVLPMGGKYAVMQIGNGMSRGFFSWMVRQVADLKYFTSIMPLGRAIRLFVSGARVYQKND